MLTSTPTFFLTLILSAIVLNAAEVETDPFADTGTAQEPEPPQEKFETTGGFEVNPISGWNPEPLSVEDFPEIENPTNFNRHFDQPSRIWRVEGGFFGSFDGGEWGGSLFFAKPDASKWTRIVETHIQDLERFEGDTFLATGGLAHLDMSGGSAYLITRLPTGQWKKRLVFNSDLGIPRIMGTTATDPFLKAESKKLVVLGLQHSLGRNPLVGIDSDGAVHHLGEQATNKETNKPEAQNKKSPTN